MDFLTRKFVELQIARTEAKDAGASGVEYGVLVFAVAAAIVVIAITVGEDVVGAFTEVHDELAPVAGP